MDFVQNIQQLETIYGQASEASLDKVSPVLTPAYRAWIDASKLCILSTVGAGGTDASPRGDDSPVVRILDQSTLALPDWRGNNRMDSLRNIVADPRASLMFLVRGKHIVIRTNGTAKITTDRALCESFAHKGNLPRSVIIFRINEVYSQCARALMRSKIWESADDSVVLPTMGDILRELSEGVFDGASYDRDWAARADKSLW